MLAPLGALALLLALLVGAPAQGAPRPHHPAKAHCAKPKPGHASCMAHVKEETTAAAAGFGQWDIHNAYGLGGTDAHGRTVAIVVAYNDQRADHDLDVYRSHYGLPACTRANGCFDKVNQTGGSTMPAVSKPGWSGEASLDMDMVSAACPSCHILLVEATTNSWANLSAAEDYAASVPGVVAINNSYGGDDYPEWSDYHHPGIAIVASTGDDGYGVEAPASFDDVVAVGGTSLYRRKDTARGWTEWAWSGAGSGCSSKNAKPSWQTAVTQCSGKAVSDVSAVASNTTPVAIYDSTSWNGISGWMGAWGTSVAAPIVAAVYALAGNTGPGTGFVPGQYLWAHASSLNDVTGGQPTGTCSPYLWCHAKAGWDAPTGLGTPHGVAAF